MKISILAPNISSNSLGRAYILARVLARKYSVELVGPSFGSNIWSPLANDQSIPVKTIQMNGLIRPYFQLKQILSMVDGDIIYCSKPLFTSLGLGLYIKRFSKKSIVLDIDDWEMGFAKNLVRNKDISALKYLISSTLYPYKSYSIWNFYLMEKLVRFADGITVSNSFLQKKFGGCIVWHGRDTETLDPRKYDGRNVRNRYHLKQDEKIVMFLGTPRPHKGLNQLIEAIKLLDRPSVTFVIVGVDDSPYCEEVIKIGKETLGDNIVFFEQQPFDKVPEFLSMADVVAVPQEKGQATLGQIPAKIFDAMAMAKPIVTTNVSDLPKILEGCGWIVQPGNVEQLSDSIKYILEHPEEAKEVGSRARQKCIQYFSWDAMEHNLFDLFDKFELASNSKQNGWI